MQRMSKEVMQALIKYTEQKLMNSIYRASLYDEESSIKIRYGGSGSGKSHSVMQEVMLKLSTLPGHNAVIIRKVDRNTATSTYPKAQKVLSEMLGDARDAFCQFIKQPYEIRFWNGNKAIFIGLDDVEKLKSLEFEKGVATMVVLEEATEFLETDLDEIERRQRGESNYTKQIYITFNPINILHWLHKRFFKGIQSLGSYREEERYIYYDNVIYDEEQGKEHKLQISILKTTFRDNANLTERDRIRLLGIKDPVQKMVYVEGEFGVLSEDMSIIDFSDMIAATEIDLKTEPDKKLIIGVDASGEGKDSSSIKASYDGVQLKLSKQDENLKITSTTALARKVIEVAEKLQKRILEQHGITPETVINVDKTGLGTGTRDALNDAKAAGQIHAKIVGVDNGARANKADKYVNKVTEMYWTLKEKIEEGKVKLLYEEQTFTEFATRKYSYEYGQLTRIALEKKPDYKKRLGKSPDEADALVLAFYEDKKKGSWVV